MKKIAFIVNSLDNLFEDKYMIVLRKKALEALRENKFDILVATDVIARGIDVDDIEAVFNHDIPNENEFYLHRIGRTARAGKSGLAFSLVSYKERDRMAEIIRYTASNPDNYEISLD